MDFIQISWVKSARFHTDFMGEICRISYGFRKTIARNGKPYVFKCAQIRMNFLHSKDKSSLSMGKLEIFQSKSLHNTSKTKDYENENNTQRLQLSCDVQIILSLW